MSIFNVRIFYDEKSIPWKLITANASVLFLSGIALGGNCIFLYQSYDHTTLTNATLGYYFKPVFVMILSPIILKSHLPIKRIVCIGVTILGMFLIVDNGLSASGKDDLLGIFFRLVAAIFYAALLLLNKFIQNMARLEITSSKLEQLLYFSYHMCFLLRD